MPKSRLLVGALTVAGFAVASMFAASPASAAALPAGQQITVLDTTGQFSEANNDTAALTAVGAGNLVELDGNLPKGIDVNDDGLGYAVATWYPEGPNGSYLYSADANTGVLDSLNPGTSTPIYFYFGDFTQRMDDCTGIDYTGGVILLACMEYDDEGEGDRAYIGVWDLDFGSAIPLIELTGDPAIDPGEENPNQPENTFDFREITAIATHPVSGLLYVFTDEYFDGVVTHGVYTASEDAGLTPVTDTGDYVVYGADFDRSGQLWASTFLVPTFNRAIEVNETGLATVNLADGSIPFSAAWADQQQDYEPLTVWGTETLAATGSAVPVAPLTIAALALLSGAILAGVTMLRRREDAV